LLNVYRLGMVELNRFLLVLLVPFAIFFQMMATTDMI
jgi:hypothetical protein